MQGACRELWSCVGEREVRSGEVVCHHSHLFAGGGGTIKKNYNGYKEMGAAAVRTKISRGRKRSGWIHSVSAVGVTVVGCG